MPWIGFVIPGRRNDRRRLAPPIVARVSGPSTDKVRQLRARLDALTICDAAAGLAEQRRQTNRYAR
jgi:hypothetical protein